MEFSEFIEITEKAVNAATENNNSTEAIELTVAAAKEISKRVSEALGIVNGFTAPLQLLVLEKYVLSLEKRQFAKQDCEMLKKYIDIDVEKINVDIERN